MIVKGFNMLFVPNTKNIVTFLNATNSTVTGTLTPTIGMSVKIPGRLMGPNGVLQFFSLLSTNNNANNRTIKYLMSGQEVASVTANSYGVGTYHKYVYNLNSSKNQFCYSLTGGGGGGISSNSPVSLTVNTDDDFYFDAQATLTDIADSVTFRFLLVTILKPFNS